MAVFTANMCIENWNCLVIGGGEIALNKAKRLIEAGGLVTLIAKETFQPLEKARLLLREACLEDLEGMRLAIFATDDKELNRSFYREAQKRGILSMAVDDLKHADFYMPAVLRRGDLEITISSNGTSPSFTVWLKNKLAEEIDDAYGAALEWFAHFRKKKLMQLPWKERISISRHLLGLDFLHYFRENRISDWESEVEEQLAKKKRIPPRP